jgi:hypothetical protein
MNARSRSPQRVICVDSCVFQGRQRSPAPDGTSPYRLERRSVLKTNRSRFALGRVNRARR